MFENHTFQTTECGDRKQKTFMVITQFIILVSAQAFTTMLLPLMSSHH